MTTPERWAWHTEVYAFRRVVLEAKEGEPSPCDPEGQWYDAALVGFAVERMIEKRDGAKRRRQQATSQRDGADGRALVNDWARIQGFETIDAYAEAHRIELLGEDGAYMLATTAIIAQTVARKRGAFRDASGKTSLDAIRAELGMTAKPERKYTPDEMAVARRQLGLDGPLVGAA